MRVRPWVLAVIAIVAVCAVVVVPLVVGRTTKSPGPASPTKGPDVVSSVAPPRQQATRVHRVAPVDARGHLVAGYRVTSTARGKCFGASLVADGLFRCFRGNTILDPCWKVAGRHAVLCLPEPWSHRLARVQVVGKLPPPAHFPQRWWALRVGDGVSVRCIAATGAAGVVRGEPVTYVCERGWVLLGDGPDRSAAVWTMGAARRAGRDYRVHGTVHLTDAWQAVRAS